MYLVRYAEEQQDVALLSISTFQKGLKDPNQLIRASALRVLSSIRVPIIAPIMMLAIKEVKCLHLNCCSAECSLRARLIHAVRHDRYSCIYAMCMNPALNKSSALHSTSNTVI